MIRFLLRRLAASLLLLFLILTFTFFLLRVVPGDPLRNVENARMTPAQLAHLRAFYGLDRPLGVQYLIWLGNVLRGDLGISYTEKRPVVDALREALPATLRLASAALIIDYGLGIFLGVAAARRRGSFFDHALRVGGLIVYSQPIFWLALMAVLLFAYQWPILPASHMHSIGAEDLRAGERWLDSLRHLILPASVLGLASAGGTARFVRARLLETMNEDYIRTARAKGLSERRVLWVHALPNAMAPIVQLFALSVSTLLSGSILTEVVFSWPGIGRLTFTASLTRDYPLILASTGLGALVVLATNLAADLSLGLIDPRTRDA